MKGKFKIWFRDDLDKQKVSKKDNTISGRLLYTFRNIKNVFISVVIVILAMLIFVTVHARYFYQVYGTSQGKIGLLKIDIASYQNDIALLVNGVEDKDAMYEKIEQNAKDIIDSTYELRNVIKEEETYKAYEKFCYALRDYIVFQKKIVEYEKVEKKYNSNKLYNEQHTELNEQLDNNLVELLKLTATTGEKLSSLKLIILLSIIVVIAIITVIIFMYSRKNIHNSINAIGASIEELKIISNTVNEGNLTLDVSEFQKNEVGDFAHDLDGMMVTIKGYIDDIRSKLNSIVEHDFTVTMDKEYKGDFSPLRTSIEEIINFLNDLFGDIKQASEEVYQETKAIYEAAKNLAEGSDNQNKSIKHAVETVEAISQNALRNEELCKNTDSVTQLAKFKAKDGAKQMQNMVLSMDRIVDTSKRINKILVDINEIAEQTTLLSLNASIEAARAGELGKGFGVVAKEISDLADRSSSAVVESTKLIEETIREVTRGNEEANNVMKILHETEEYVDSAALLVSQIHEATDSQKVDLNSTLVEMTNVENVIFYNSKATEECANSCEGLKKQARMLRNNLKNIKYKNA